MQNIKIKILNISILLIVAIVIFTTNKALAVGAVRCVVTGGGACTASGIASESTLSSVKKSLGSGGNIDKKLDTTQKQTKVIQDNTTKDLKNFDATQAASQASGEAISKISEIVTKSLGLTQDDLNNVFTNGSQIVTNLKDFLNKNSLNAIKNVINDQSESANIYTGNALKNIVQNIRSSTDIVTISLPHIAKEEICSNEKLKDVIKNGEPENYIKPKPAVENVEIDELCDTNLLKSDKEALKGQATFIALAKAGYGGQATKMALADPANTPGGVESAIYNKISEKKTDAENIATKLFENNGGVIGNLVCLDEKGEPKKFDPTDPKKSFCNNLASSVSESAVKIKADLDAARQAPYLNIVAQAQNAKDPCAKDSGVSKLTGSAVGIVKGIDGIKGKTTTTYFNEDFSVAKTEEKGLANTTTTTYNEDGSKKVETKGGAENIANKINSAACSIGKYTSILNNILSLGGTSIKDLVGGGKEDQYAQLANSLDDLIETDIKIQEIATEGSGASEEEEGGDTEYDKINLVDEALERYDRMREINIERLNNEVYTYVFMNVAKIVNGTGLINQINWNLHFYENSVIYNLRPEHVQLRAAGEFKLVGDSIKEDIKKLIKQMAIDNYKQQELSTLKTKILTKTEGVPSTIETINELLKSFISEKDIENAENYWNSVVSNPEIPQYEILLTQDQKDNFSTKENLAAIREKIYILATAVGIPLNGETNMGGIVDYTDELPTKFNYYVDLVTSKDYSEKTFCQKIANNICSN